jgi:thiol-disulfide isomerase/thioredoxin
MEKTLQDMKKRQDDGKREVDDPDRAPTGEPYRRMQQQAHVQQEQRRVQQEQERLEEVRNLQVQKENVQNQNEGDSSDDDDEDWLNDDSDPDLQDIRQARIQQLKQSQAKHAENMAKGHGQYRTITQDEFLPECTSSEYVAVHFFHDEFERCKIMDHHLKQIAPQHSACKFLRISAEKAPFFVHKLQIKTLPTLLVFHDGNVSVSLMRLIVSSIKVIITGLDASLILQVLLR